MWISLDFCTVSILQQAVCHLLGVGKYLIMRAFLVYEYIE
jgi:hypothetical protein